MDQLTYGHDLPMSPIDHDEDIRQYRLRRDAMMACATGADLASFLRKLRADLLKTGTWRDIRDWTPMGTFSEWLPRDVQNVTNPIAESQWGIEVVDHLCSVLRHTWQQHRLGDLRRAAQANAAIQLVRDARKLGIALDTQQAARLITR